jgi:hypothetical protein
MTKSKSQVLKEELNDLQFATNPTEEKGLMWRWTKHGLDILSIYIQQALTQQKSEIIKEVGGMEKNSKTKSAFIVMIDKSYNQALDDVIEQLKK